MNLQFPSKFTENSITFKNVLELLYLLHLLKIIEAAKMKRNPSSLCEYQIQSFPHLLIVCLRRISSLQVFSSSQMKPQMWLCTCENDWISLFSTSSSSIIIAIRLLRVCRWCNARTTHKCSFFFLPITVPHSMVPYGNFSCATTRRRGTLIAHKCDNKERRRVKWSTLKEWVN